MGQATNTFSEGMIKDINPINVPQTALTDCKNGTIITYNGNEFSLQNDMGNCELINCKLPTGYVPVGMKEYGGILYIVSYNPVLNKTEIGSYPSTKVGAKLESGSTLQRTITYIDWDVENNYTTILKKCRLQVFTDKNPDPWKINPGDEVVLEWETEVQEVDENGDAKFDEKGDPIMKAVETDKLKDYPCQKTEFYIMDENRNLTNIDEYIKEHLKHYTGNMSTTKEDEVRWKIPGWLAVKLCFPDLDNFLINFKLTKEPSFKVDGEPSNMSFALGFRAIMSDGLYTGNTTDPQMHVEYKIKLVSTEGAETEITYLDTPFTSEKVDMPNGQYYFNSLDTDFNDVEVQKGDKIVVTATPYIGRVEYDKFAKEFTYTADSVVFDESKVNFGVNYFTYAISDNELLLTFDTTGMSKTTGAILKCGLCRLSGANKTIDKNNNEIVAFEWKDIVDDSGNLALLQIDQWEIAEDITTKFIINLDEYKEDWNINKDIVAEDIYKLIFKVIIGEKTFEREKIIVASKLLNGFSDKRYDLITFDRWFANYKQNIIGDWTTLNNPRCTMGDVVDFVNPEWYDKINVGEIKKHPYFVNNKKYTEVGSVIQSVFAKQKYTIVFDDLKENLVFPHGPMWNDIYKLLEIIISIDNNINRFKIDQYTGKIIRSEIENKEINSNVAIENKYTISHIDSFNEYCYNYQLARPQSFSAFDSAPDFITPTLLMESAELLGDTSKGRMFDYAKWSTTFRNLDLLTPAKQIYSTTGGPGGGPGTVSYEPEKNKWSDAEYLKYIREICGTQAFWPFRMYIPAKRYDIYGNKCFNSKIKSDYFDYIYINGSGQGPIGEATLPGYFVMLTGANVNCGTAIFVNTPETEPNAAQQNPTAANKKAFELAKWLNEKLEKFTRGNIIYGGFLSVIKNNNYTNMLGTSIEIKNNIELNRENFSFCNTSWNLIEKLNINFNEISKVDGLYIDNPSYIDISSILQPNINILNLQLDSFATIINNYTIAAKNDFEAKNKSRYYKAPFVNNKEYYSQIENNTYRRKFLDNVASFLNGFETNDYLYATIWAYDHGRQKEVSFPIAQIIQDGVDGSGQLKNEDLEN